MERNLVMAAALIFLVFMLIGIVAVKFMPRTERHLRFGSLFLDSFADAIALEWVVYFFGKWLRIQWVDVLSGFGWLTILIPIVLTFLLIPLNKVLVKHRLFKQESKTQMASG